MALSRDELLSRIERNSHTIVFRPNGWPITVNKIHAAQYGAIIGIVMGIVYVESSLVAASALTIALLVTFGVSVERIANVAETTLVDADSAVGTSEDPRVTLVVLTIQHKPHYFWLVLLPTMLTVSTVYSLL
jgi:hypothetical protein